MARIHEGVLNSVLHDRPDLAPLLSAFLGDFDVTFGTATRLYGSDVNVFILKPNKNINMTFGFDKEILLLHSQYSVIQPRIFTIVNQLMSEDPFAGRVEPLLFALITPAPNPEEQVRKLMSDKSQNRILIPFGDSECRRPIDPFFVRNRMATYLFQRNLFDMSNPIDSDLYFFGRNSFVMELRDSLKGGENIGLFGLRKVGKTSILLRLKRLLEAEQSGRMVRIDLEDQQYYQLRWWELLEKIGQLLGRKKPKTSFTEQNASQLFKELIIDLKKNQGKFQYVVALDEIEHICPGEKLRMRPHWDRDFLEFWKTMRAIQNDYSFLSFVVCGVNAAPIETTTYSGHDNPLFSLASKKYVPFFDASETRQMVRTLGRFMGMHFDERCYSYLVDTYGGHPLLVRQACSQLFKDSAGSPRPIDVTLEKLSSGETERNLKLFAYAEHILNVLRDWYPDELDMLKRLAEGDTKTFSEFESEIPMLAAHLRAYGLVVGTPARISMRFIEDYLARERLFRERFKRGAKPESVDQPLEVTLSEIGITRNRLEPKLRQFLRVVLMGKLGPLRWIDPILRSLPEKRRDELAGVDKMTILNERLFLLDVLQIIVRNWSDFRQLEELPNPHRVTKSQFEVLLDYVNKHREDAHAKKISAPELAAFKAAATAIEGIVEQYL